MVQGEERARHAACNVLLSVRAGVHHERTCRRGCMANLRKGCSKDSLPLSVSKKMEKTKKAETFLPGPLPGEGPYDVRQHQRRRKTKKEKAKAKKAATRKATAALTATQYKQPTMLRRCRAAMTRATLKVATRRSATASTPDSTGKANFPHDADEGALVRRAGHISKKRRKKLDGELAQANSSEHDAQLVD